MLHSKLSQKLDFSRKSFVLNFTKSPNHLSLKKEITWDIEHKDLLISTYKCNLEVHCIYVIHELYFFLHIIRNITYAHTKKYVNTFLFTLHLMKQLIKD